jgi:hypothetical protein
MELILTGIFIGILGTVVMDVGNILFASFGLINRVDLSILGRMAVGWTRGRFVYDNPDELEPVAVEKLLGGLTHYGIGICLAFVYVLGWAWLHGGKLSTGWVLMYGVCTTAMSYFLVYPSMGLGVFGLKSTDGIRNMYSSLANHIFFGTGMALAVLLLSN